MTEPREQPTQAPVASARDDVVTVADPIWGRNMFILGFITGCAFAIIVACVVAGPVVR